MLVNLVKRVKVDGRWKWLAVPRKGGRFQPEKVTEEGVFYLEWRPQGRGGPRKQERVSENPREAMEALRNKQAELDDPQAVQEPAPDPQLGPTVEEAVTNFLTNIKATKSRGTLRDYTTQTTWFLAHAPKKRIGQFTRDDIMSMFAKGREQGFSQGYINRKVIVALGVIRDAGFDVKLNKGDWPATAEGEPEVFDMDVLKAFFAACNDRERLIYSVFLYTGFRKMEVATLRWSHDIDWKGKLLKVAIKPELKFSPKRYEWRSVRVPAALIDRLKAWQKANKDQDTDLMFPSRPHPNGKWGGKGIDTKLLEQCKAVAFNADLNCGRCDTDQGRCADGPYCEHWFLHKFRHTFATNMLRDGVDIKTLQTLLGHKSLATTEKYLKSLRLHDLEDKIENSTMAGLLVA